MNDNDASIYTGAVDVANDGIDQDCDGLDATAGVSEAQATWSVFPNPATSGITLQHSASHRVSNLTLTDLLGRPVTSVAFTRQPAGWHVDLTHLAGGMYRLTWLDEGNTFSTPVHKILR